jgi:cleavage stimulation factor subunit 1
MEEEKNKLYQLILRQLQKDGYTRAAELLSDTALLPFEKRLIVDDEPDLEAIVHHHYLTYVPTRHKSQSSLLNDLVLGTTLDLDTPAQTRARTPAPFPRLTLRHAGQPRCGAFNWDGTVFASASADGEIKVVDSQLAFRDGIEDTSTGAVRKTFLDHTDAVTALVFHPRARVLLSGSRDKTIRMFVYSSMSTRAFESISDSHPVRALALHPSGDFILAGCRHPLLRMYITDQPRAAPLVANVSAQQHHSEPINYVSWSVDGSQYVSASQDGSVKVWDAVSSRVTRTFARIHDGTSVNTAAISRNGAYILSSGNDSTVRVTDLRTGATLRKLIGGMSTTKGVRAVFWGASEEYVLCGSEDGSSILMWDIASASLLGRLNGHSGTVLSCVANPVAGVGGSPLSFASCSVDGTVKFWSE